MPEAVIVSAARSPIGRANKGSLKDLRPDDLAATIVQDGARPGAGTRPAHRRRPLPRLRPARRRAGLQHGPGRQRPQRHGRRARRDHHPLLRLVGADHADGVPRDQGGRGRRVHLGRRRDGVELRPGHLRPLAGHPEPALRRRRRAHREDRRGRPGLARPTRGRHRPRHLHRDGPDRRERRPAARPDPPGARRVRRTQPEPRREGDRRRLLGARDHPGHHARRHRGARRRRPPAGRHHRGAPRSSSRSSAPTAS